MPHIYGFQDISIFNVLWSDVKNEMWQIFLKKTESKQNFFFLQLCPRSPQSHFNKKISDLKNVKKKLWAFFTNLTLIWPFKVTQGQRSWCQKKGHIWVYISHL